MWSILDPKPLVGDNVRPRCDDSTSYLLTLTLQIAVNIGADSTKNPLLALDFGCMVYIVIARLWGYHFVNSWLIEFQTYYCNILWLSSHHVIDFIVGWLNKVIWQSHYMYNILQYIYIYIHIIIYLYGTCDNPRAIHLNSSAGSIFFNRAGIPSGHRTGLVENATRNLCLDDVPMKPFHWDWGISHVFTSAMVDDTGGFH